VDGRIRDEVVSWYLVFGDAEIGEGSEIGFGRAHDEKERTVGWKWIIDERVRIEGLIIRCA
jgi:hypothetical protein